jgi:hypothetical protein
MGSGMAQLQGVMWGLTHLSKLLLAGTQHTVALAAMLSACRAGMVLHTRDCGMLENVHPLRCEDLSCLLHDHSHCGGQPRHRWGHMPGSQPTRCTAGHLAEQD